jgi:hypothetical protein
LEEEKIVAHQQVLGKNVAQECKNKKIKNDEIKQQEI